MAKTITAFTATPRKNGNSEILVDHILAGATQAGASAEKVRLHDLSVRPCTACEACQASVAEPCIIEDDMASLLDKVRQLHAELVSREEKLARVPREAGSQAELRQLLRNSPSVGYW